MRIIVPVALCTVAFLSGCGKGRAPGPVKVDPALAQMVPGDTAVLVDAKLDQLRETPVYQKNFSRMPLPQLDAFAKDTGLDPRKDLQEMLFASNGTDKGVLLVRGKFATAELEPKLEQKGKRIRYNGHNLFGDDRNSVCFVNSTMAVAGSTAVLKKIIDQGAGAGIPAGLRAQIQAIPAGAQFWAVFSGPAIKLPFADDSNLGNLNQIIRSIDQGRFSADLRNGFDFQAAGACNSDASAKQIHDTMRGLIGLGRLSTPENQPELLRVYDGIDVRQEGRTVNVAAKIPEDVIDKFVHIYTESRR